MNRRDFLKSGLTGLAALAGSEALAGPFRRRSQSYEQPAYQPTQPQFQYPQQQRQIQNPSEYLFSYEEYKQAMNLYTQMTEEKDSKKYLELNARLAQTAVARKVNRIYENETDAYFALAANERQALAQFYNRHQAEIDNLNKSVYPPQPTNAMDAVGSIGQGSLAPLNMFLRAISVLGSPATSARLKRMYGKDISNERRDLALKDQIILYLEDVYGRKYVNEERSKKKY